MRERYGNGELEMNKDNHPISIRAPLTLNEIQSWPYVIDVEKEPFHYEITVGSGISNTQYYDIGKVMGKRMASQNTFNITVEGDDSMSTPERALPESQQKGDTEAQSTEITPYDEAAELSQVFADIENKTTDDGKILCDVKGIYSTTNGGSLSVEVELPGDAGTETFTMTRPKAWLQSYEFVRFVEQYGYGSANFESMITDDVRVTVIDESNMSDDYTSSGPKDYELHIPESRTQSVKSRFQSMYETIQVYTQFNSFQGVGIHLIGVGILCGVMVYMGTLDGWETGPLGVAMTLGLMGAVVHLFFNMVIASLMKGNNA